MLGILVTIVVLYFITWYAFTPRSENGKTYCSLISGHKMIKAGPSYFGKFRYVFGRAVEDIETDAQDWRCTKCDYIETRRIDQ